MTSLRLSLKEIRKTTIGPDRTGRRTAYYTQQEVADEAGIDRSIYNALENERGRAVTAEYAQRLEPVLGPLVWELIPQPQMVERPDPDIRLRELEAEVARIRAELQQRNEIAAEMAGVARRNQQAIRSHDKALRDVLRRLSSLEEGLGDRPAEHLP